MNRDRLPPPFPEHVDRIDRIFLPWRDANPDGIALRDDACAIAYRDLDRIVEQTATRLRTAGVRPGDRVLLVAENSVALAVCILAASRAGAWSATVNARLSPREIGDFLAHAGARLAM
ncbi:MAG: AMP-binding protein [Burkholderiaceae bacterium]